VTPLPPLATPLPPLAKPLLTPPLPPLRRKPLRLPRKRRSNPSLTVRRPLAG
jgi:hypothetical protein